MKKKLISALLIFALLVAFVPYGLPTAQAAGSPSDFSWDNATVYFLLTDRFYNGNPANDHSYGRGLDQSGKVVQGIDPSATFHGGDFAGITKKIEEGYFTDLGVNAIWLSAPYEQIHGYVPGWGGDCFPHFGYHGYYALDYTQPDANFGTKAEFKTMVDTAHEYGIRIVLDVVMNHAGYVTLKDMDEYGFGSFNGSWQSHYYSYKPNLNTYTNHINYSTDTGWSNWWGRDWVRVSGADDGRKPPSYDGPGSTDETMCLSNLPDFKTETTNTVSVPVLLQNKWTKEGRLTQETDKLNAFFTRTGRPKTVTNHLVAWLSEWVREYGIDGFRCDTAKHIEMAAWKALKDECVEALRYWKGQNPTKKLDDLDFWMTGETWNWNIGSGKDRHFTQGGFDSMINFETQGAGLLSASNVAGTHARYATSINTTAGFNVLSYVSSHDTVRASGDRIAIGSGLLLLPGAVQIYYGDETGLPLDSAAWPGSDHRLRGDMNWNSMDGAALEHWQLVGTFRG
ncbi:MAG: alpha-amylase family glycosyl hydrolase, partial [Clostridiales bacterium]|nr:alpha-amylase family glycosyl hydrolase [Clostridiales bacterium]